jgi:bla regulator protein BlaR1
MRTAFAAVAVAALSVSGAAQQLDTARAVFEVASIKPATFPNEPYFEGYTSAGTCTPSRTEIAGPRLFIRAVSLCGLIRNAYELREDQVIGLPAWATKREPSAFFEVDARAPTGTTLDAGRAREMLRALLRDRFQLAFHREPRKAPIYALVLGKAAHKLSTQELPCAKPGPPITSFTTGSMEACKPTVTMAQLALTLTSRLDRPVVDRTGLADGYAFRLQWAGREPLAGTDDAPSLFTAVQDQLGLRLEARTDTVEALVIDRVEPPSPN